MAFPDLTWPCVGDLFSRVFSPEEEVFTWGGIREFLWECWKVRNGVRAGAKKMKSVEFSFAAATWNLFIFIDRAKLHCQFGINVLRHSSSDTEFDCYISFESLSDVIKDLKCKLKCDSAGTHWAVDSFLSASQLDEFLQNGREIACRIRINKSSSCIEAPTQSQLLGNYWDTRNLSKIHSSAWAVDVLWNIHPFLKECEAARDKLGASNKQLKSVDFSFGDATFNLFISFDAKKSLSLFRLNFQSHTSSDEEFDFCCDISSKKFKFNFKCEISESYREVKDFFSEDELQDFLHEKTDIYCEISRKKCRPNSSKRSAVVAHTGTQHLESSGSVCEVSRKKCRSNSSKRCAVEAHSATQHLENEDDEDKDPVVKMLQDYRNLLMTGEGSDVTIQVKDKTFKAHRLVLMARSSVFASMFRHNMKENATGFVEVKDCDPLSFPVLLEFIYCSTTEKLSVENVFSLFTSADKYDMQDLKRKCLKFIMDNMSVDTFCETVKLSLQHSETNLLKFAIDFFAENFKEILLTVKWQAFIVENPIQSNEILIKALASDR